MTLWDIMLVLMFVAGFLMVAISLRAMPPTDYKIKRSYRWKHYKSARENERDGARWSS